MGSLISALQTSLWIIPSIVDNYRAGHEIAMRHSAGQASTEDLRQAMMHYRVLFEELLGEDKTYRKGA